MHQTIEKNDKKLETSPFKRRFEYGSNNQGYWNYSHMVIQFEDCIDCLKAIYADQFEYLFYFDHSSGHDKLRSDGLNKNTMNKGYGGKQKK